MAESKHLCNPDSSQDVQGRSHELLSSTKGLTGQVQNIQNNNQIRDNEKSTEKKSKTKKCHGNRKEQHKKRAVRRKQERLNLNLNHTDQNALELMDHDMDEERELCDVCFIFCKTKKNEQDILFRMLAIIMNFKFSQKTNVNVKK